jgi:hypothetical protein
MSRKDIPNMSDLQESMILQFVAMGVPQSLAAEAVDYCPQAISMKKVRDAAFKTRLDSARAKGAIARIVKVLRSDKWQAHAWYLERTHPELFARVEARVIEAAGKNAGATSDANLWRAAVASMPSLVGEDDGTFESPDPSGPEPAGPEGESA